MLGSCWPGILVGYLQDTLNARLMGVGQPTVRIDGMTVGGTAG